MFPRQGAQVQSLGPKIPHAMQAKKRERERKEGGGRVRERRRAETKKPLSASLLLASLNEFKRGFLKMLNSDSTLQLFHEIDSLIQSLLFCGRN